MKKDHRNYRRDTIRAGWWDYAGRGVYFVTINTKGRVRWFGEVIDGVMQLSLLGAIVQMEWLKTFEMRPDMNLSRGAYVVMPDHFHALIGIGENRYNTGNPKDIEKDKGTGYRAASFGPQRKNLASVIRGFKIGVSKNARHYNPDFAWQSRYYDRIVRDKEAFEAITQYIRENPAKWKRTRAR